jgi:high affinity Mn2+ porin
MAWDEFFSTGCIYSALTCAHNQNHLLDKASVRARSGHALTAITTSATLRNMRAMFVGILAFMVWLGALAGAAQAQTTSSPNLSGISALPTKRTSGGVDLAYGQGAPNSYAKPAQTSAPGFDPASPITLFTIHTSLAPPQSQQLLERLDAKFDTTPPSDSGIGQTGNAQPSDNTATGMPPLNGPITPGGAPANQAAQPSTANVPPANAASTNGAGGYTMGGGSGQFNMFDHTTPGPLWVSGQVNYINQYKPNFYSKYSGPNSFNNRNEGKGTVASDLFVAYQFVPHLEGFLNYERFDGEGLSAVEGLGALTNLDALRNGSSLRAKFFIARCGLHLTIPLSKKTFDADRGPANLSTKLPERRIECRIGAFSATDFMNYNSVGSDTHHQFLNWCICNDGWYDYPANTRGYTWGGEWEYQSPHFAAKFLEAAMPIVANGESLVWRPSTAHSETYELEFRHKTLPNRAPGIVRLLAFQNTADMGNYRQAINTFLAGYTPTPNIVAVAKPGTVKFGFGINAEQEIAEGVTAFTRMGFNNGATETYCFTEVDNTFVVGLGFDGARWHRRGDKFGVAVLSNGLSKAHRQYLALGGLGFDLGDGALNYGREEAGEAYYTFHLWKGIYFGPDFQYIINPGYNRDRGAAAIFTLRLHVDI